MKSAAVLLPLLLSAAALAEGTAPRPPNVVLILADDLGYAGIGVQGCRDIPTPHIDGVAAAGVRFTSGYVSCPVCAPTRAGLLTGRYQQRFGFEFNPGPRMRASERFGLPLAEKTIAERLKERGYATGMVGKWHEGFAEAMQPTRRGFDEFFGFLSGAHPYLPGGRGRDPILRGTRAVEEPGYLTDAFTREAVAFIERHRGEPFFLYLPYNAVHAPLQAKPEDLARFASLADPKRQTHAAMLAALDRGVGAVVAKLAEHGLLENTLLFFLSDNGGPTLQTSSSNAPLRGTKGQVFEGGIRVPFLMQWKGRISGGRTCDAPVISLDILPTILAAAGAPADPALDGADLLPYVAGARAEAPHDALYWRYGDQWAIRRGDWKVACDGRSAPALYNLKADIGETTDLALKAPERLKELMTLWQAWHAQLKPPAWQRG